MSVGDVVSAHSSVTNDGFLSIQPSGTIKWGLQNIYAPSNVTWELYRTDGTNAILIVTSTGTLQLPQPFNVTNGIYFRIKNVSGSTSYIGYDGKVSNT